MCSQQVLKKVNDQSTQNHDCEVYEGQKCGTKHFDVALVAKEECDGKFNVNDCLWIKELVIDG